MLLKSREPICVMTVRAELDEYCLRKTIAAGACLQKIAARAADCALRRWRAVCSLPARPIEPAFWSAPMGQAARCGGCARTAPGFPGALRSRSKLRRRAEEVDLTFDFAAVRNGYAWIFPKGDHLNVGRLFPIVCGSNLTRSSASELRAGQGRHGDGGSCDRAISGYGGRRVSGRTVRRGLT